MKQYEEVVHPKWSRIDEELTSIDITRLLRDKDIKLMSDVIPLVYIGESKFYVTESMFFSITGVNMPDRVIHKLKSGICLYQYDFMELLARRLNQYETMTRLQKAMIYDYQQIINMRNERI